MFCGDRTAILLAYAVLFRDAVPLEQNEEEKKKLEAEEVPARLQYFLDHTKIKHLKQQFQIYDADGSGAINVDGDL